MTDGSANIIGFFQKDNYFYFDRQWVDYVAANPGTFAVLVTVSVPPNMVGYFNVGGLSTSGTVSNILFTSPNQAGYAPSANNYDIRPNSSTVSTNAVKMIETDSSSQIRVYLSYSDALVTVRLQTIGFFDDAKSD